MKSEEEFDDLFRDKLSESSGHYSPENWERMQLLLNASHGAKGAFIWSRLNNMVAVIGVGVGAFVGSQLFFVEPTPTRLDFTQKIQKEIPVQEEIAQLNEMQIQQEETNLKESGTVKDLAGIAAKGISTGNTSGNKNNYLHRANTAVESSYQVASNTFNTNTGQVTHQPENTAASKRNVEPVISGANSETLAIQEITHENTLGESAKLMEEQSLNESTKANEILENISTSASVETPKSETTSLEQNTETSLPPQETVLVNEVKIPAEESPAAISDPIITGHKVLPVNFGLEAGLQVHNPWGANPSGSVAAGYMAGAHLRVQVQPKTTLTAQVNFTYRTGVNLPKTSYVYAYDFNLVKIPITVNVNGLSTANLLAGVRYSFGKFGAAEINLGGQFIMDTHAKVSSTVDTIPLPSGNWGYRSGVTRWDWMAGIGYDYSFCKHFEGFANYRYGFNKDNTDNVYFGSNRNDVNRFFQVGLRYFIKPAESNAPERFK